MSRIPTGDEVRVAPKSNVYTVLAIIGTLVAVLGLVVLFLKAKQLLPDQGIL